VKVGYCTKFDKDRSLAHPGTWESPGPLHLIRPIRNKKDPARLKKFPSISWLSPPVPRGKQPPAATHRRPTRPRTQHSRTARARPMAASLRSPPPVPAAFRRSRAVVRASSSSSSSTVSSSSSAPKARFVARRSESVSVQQLARPLGTRSLHPSSPRTSWSPCSLVEGSLQITVSACSCSGVHELAGEPVLGAGRGAHRARRRLHLPMLRIPLPLLRARGLPRPPCPRRRGTQRLLHSPPFL
jgi:hypothetical protein